jgi:hypothetical protein
MLQGTYLLISTYLVISAVGFHFSACHCPLFLTPFIEKTTFSIPTCSHMLPGATVLDSINLDYSYWN